MQPRHNEQRSEERAKPEPHSDKEILFLVSPIGTL